jgi:hypothetical protein
MIAKFAQERWVRSFLSTPGFAGAPLEEGGVARKAAVHFWVETKARPFVFNNNKGGLS